MELGCTRRGFGRDVQPAAPNRPRCWALVGPALGAISRMKPFAQHLIVIVRGVSGEPVSSYGAFGLRGNSTHRAEAYP